MRYILIKRQRNLLPAISDIQYNQLSTQDQLCYAIDHSHYNDFNKAFVKGQDVELQKPTDDQIKPSIHSNDEL